MPDPYSSGDASEWIELFNSSNKDVDISGWFLDGKQIDPNTQLTIPSQGFYIFTKDLNAFFQEFGDMTNVVQFSISLANSGDTITLTDNGETIDTFVYAGSTPNISWERTGGLCADVIKHPTSHSILQTNTNLSIECSNPAVDNLKIKFSLDNKTWVDTLSSVAPASVFVRLNSTVEGDITSVLWKLDNGLTVNNPIDLYNYTNKSIQAYVTYSDGSTRVVVSQAINILPKLIINEFMPNPDGSDNGFEWIEIYNPDSQSVNLFGYIISDKSGQVYSFNDGEYISGRNYYLVELDKAVLNNCTKASCVEAISIQGMTGLVIDTTSYDDSKSGQSWSLGSDSNWHMDYAVTPGSVNFAPSIQSIDYPEISEEKASEKNEEGKDDIQELDLPLDQVEAISYEIDISIPEVITTNYATKLDYNYVPAQWSFILILIVNLLVLVWQCDLAGLVFNWWGRYKCV